MAELPTPWRSWTAPGRKAPRLTNVTGPGAILVQTGRAMDPTPADAFLATFPLPIVEAAGRLRAVVRSAVPDAVERVREGWRLIGYDLPIGRRSVFFAYIAPEPIHVHLGFEFGFAMADPEHALEGAHLRLKKVRYVTFAPGQPIPTPALVELTREAARVAGLTRDQRLAIALDRDSAPR